MKNNYVLLVLLCPLFLFSQIDPYDIFSELDRSDMNTTILFNHALSFSEIHEAEKVMFTTNDFFQAYNELAAADSERRFLNFEELKDAVSKSRHTGVIPLGLVYTEFDILGEEAFDDGDVFVTNGKLRKSTIADGPIFETRKKLFAAPFRGSFDQGSLQFVLDARFFVNTTSEKIKKIQVDFGEGNGYRNIDPDQVLSVNYGTPGEKDILFKITLSSGETFLSRSSISIRSDSVIGARQAQVFFTSTITPDLSAYGEPTNYPGEGEYEIFLDTVDGILDKPIIAVDGFDPGDSRNIAGIYSSLDYTDIGGPQNFADDLRSQGFDIVILNFPVYVRAADMQEVDGGADFIERNAMLLVDLINIVNASKVGSEQNVIIGPSMGGLISRYALNYMENQSIPHDTRLFLSFDSPHRGANVPIGLQHLINYMAFGLGSNNVVELQDFINGLAKSSAARQMLVDHLESHLQGGSDVEFDPALLLPAPHPFKTTFDSNMNALTSNGFPQTVRNVAIINGSGIGNPFPDKMGADVTPGFNLLNDTFTIDAATSTTADLQINYTPPTASGSQLVSSIVISVFGFPVISSSANSQAFSYSDGVDAGSGGLYEMSLFGGSTPPPGLITDFINALNSEFFNFIPSISAIALDITANGEIDWYHDINIGSGSPPTAAPGDVVDSTPFINWLMPDDNQEHVLLTEENVTFALNEIMAGTLSISSEELASLRLESNPIKDQLGLITDNPIEDAELKIYDLGGRLVLEKSMPVLTGTTQIRVDLSSGLYILKIRSGEGIYSAKLVVE